jgi:hypothetical protein
MTVEDFGIRTRYAREEFEMQKQNSIDSHMHPISALGALFNT